MEGKRIVNDEASVLLGLTLVPGAGRATVSLALEACVRLGMPLQALVRMPLLELAAGLPQGGDGLLKALKRFDEDHLRRAEDLLRRAASGGVGFVSKGRDGYPACLETHLGGSAPAFLFVRGNVGLLDKRAVAVVGARKASRRGLAVANACASAFACEGVVVVSGGAAGVDTAAHEAAMEAGGATVVVLPQGILDYCVPRYLDEGMEAGRVAIVSEFVPDAPWEAHAAVTRNATISACASLVCVVEPRKTGGSMRTARHGLSQGKRVLVFGEDESASGVAALRRDGAGDLLDEGGTVNAERLLGLWRAGAQSAPVQDTLW